MKVLDAGAYGVICPMVNSREEAERLVSYVRYPPTGTRSFGPTRANFSAGANYGGEADDQIVCFAMIETREAFERVEEIAATPGLDGVYIGPADLTLGLTGKSYRTGFDREEPEMVEAIKARPRGRPRAGIRAGLHCGIARLCGQGDRLGIRPRHGRQRRAAARGRRRGERRRGPQARRRGAAARRGSRRQRLLRCRTFSSPAASMTPGSTCLRSRAGLHLRDGR